jgi:4-diphosphocytidyl-2-C-methyl-D-erythritol kinase
LALRGDGYHEVRLALVPVSLYDEIAWEPGGKGLALEVVGSREALGPRRDNLVYRAALAFQSVSNLSVQGRLRLTKHVPSGAGLGGGSANAAGTLVVLNRWHGSPLSPRQLWELAQGLGADVPFFLAPQAQWAEGRGERLTPIADFPRLHVLVVKPPFGIRTAQAYRRTTPRPEAAPRPPLRTVEEVLAALVNDFEPALFPAYPLLPEIKARLLAAGARGALLSGSGSALFGIFAAAAGRDAAAATLAAQEPAWTVLPCDTLEHHDYTERHECSHG